MRDIEADSSRRGQYHYWFPCVFLLVFVLVTYLPGILFNLVLRSSQRVFVHTVPQRIKRPR